MSFNIPVWAAPIAASLVFASTASSAVYDYRFSGSLDPAGTFDVTFRMEVDLPPDQITDDGAAWIYFLGSGSTPIITISGMINDFTFAIDQDQLQSPGAFQFVAVNANATAFGSRDEFSINGLGPNTGPVLGAGIALIAGAGESSLTGLNMPTTNEELDLSTFDDAGFSYTSDNGIEVFGNIDFVSVTLVPTPGSIAPLLGACLFSTRRRR